VTLLQSQHHDYSFPVQRIVTKLVITLNSITFASRELSLHTQLFFSLMTPNTYEHEVSNPIGGIPYTTRHLGTLSNSYEQRWEINHHRSTVCNFPIGVISWRAGIVAEPWMSLVRVRVKSHITTDSQSVGLSWCWAPSGGSWPDICLFISFGERYSPVYGGRHLWRDVGSVACQSVSHLC
jgi:hypothetical protein